MNKTAAKTENEINNAIVSGEFVDFAGERFYVIRNVDRVLPFFISLISNVDHWLFISSTGGLTAGRVSPETALFPYVSVDKIHESSGHTGSKTLFRVINGPSNDWEPFKSERSERYVITRSLYKNVIGNKLCFEEINHDLGLQFRYTWMTSESYGFVRRCEVKNLNKQAIKLDLVDGLQNILPAGTPRFAQTNTSNLVDAYKWTELDQASGLAMFALYSGVTDRAEPSESLRANTAFCMGLDSAKILLSSNQLNDFRVGRPLQQEELKRGVRGSYLVNTTLQLAAGETREWQIVANLEQSQSDVVSLLGRLSDRSTLAEEINTSIAKGTDELARIMASSDGFQSTAEENVSAHHYANVLFNVLRGGIFDDQYSIPARDFVQTIGSFNRGVHARNKAWLDGLSSVERLPALLQKAADTGDLQLERLCREYLPITFGRRHGDPSRPWNQFAIRLKDEQGNRLLSYQGNWRDIFQNWEALALSFPEFIESMIAKFVNASTIDGYNPYRITKEGIDWEVEEPDDPWSYIGYWGDHQIIYLQKLLEISRSFHPAELNALLRKPIFCYANVPYRIRPFEALLEDPKNTVDYDEAMAETIEHRVAEMGADGKLLPNASGEVGQVNLLEKLLVPLLSKLGNLVVDGGIWLNTQRPEWNDANNALVGQGLSMVTLYYLRRYVSFLQDLLQQENGDVDLSSDMATWLVDTAAALAAAKDEFTGTPFTSARRFELLTHLGQASSRYRDTVYRSASVADTTPQSIDSIRSLLSDALAAIDHSIASNRDSDGLYNAYNTLSLKGGKAEIKTLYPMLEGQVAALSAGSIGPEEAADVVDALFKSDVYRKDQKSFMLYPDRKLPTFLQKNCVPAERVREIALLKEMLASSDSRIIETDAQENYRFNADFTNTGDLLERLDGMTDIDESLRAASRDALVALYESVFNHQEFTGRSGGMFGFEGLGSIYWHMVSKLLLAVQENFFAALEASANETVRRRLGELYYRIREGIGFNKTPGEYGAFPCDPYSHSPKHAGARQPGMTGQVKEEILSRFGELGVRVRDGATRFAPALLRRQEFAAHPAPLRYVDVDHQWQELSLADDSLAFTWCQVPVVYALRDSEEPSIRVVMDDGSEEVIAGDTLPPDKSAELFLRSGRLRSIHINIQSHKLFS